MIAVIRIRGQVALEKKAIETLHRLKLRKKYTCIAINPSEEEMGMINSVRNFVSFGEISDATYKKLVDARGKKDTEGKLKPFFALHPPRGGANTKLHYPKGILGENKEMDKLLEKML